MKSKNAMRQEIEAGITAFLAAGKQITKAEAIQSRGRRSGQPKEKMIEIEVNHLPKALQDKFFSEN